MITQTDRLHEKTRHFASEIGYIYRSAKRNQSTSGQIREQLKGMVYDHPDYKKIRMYQREYLAGYQKACFDIHWQNIEWVHWYGGKFVGKDLPYGDNFKGDLVESAHVYKGTTNKY